MIGEIESQYWGKQQTVLGIDEVGRGSIAGPVYAACVSLDAAKLLQLDPSVRSLIRDSKSLSKKQRESVVHVIDELAIEHHIGSSSAREIEKLGIVPATFLAIKRALRKCVRSYDMLLFDGSSPLPFYKKPQRNIIKGDAKCYTIAAASIIAKVSRDTYMTDQAKKYPWFHFEKNAGYGTKEHLIAMQNQGPCLLHRKNFAPTARIIQSKDL